MIRKCQFTNDLSSELLPIQLKRTYCVSPALYFFFVFEKLKQRMRHQCLKTSHAWSLKTRQFLKVFVV